MKMNLSLLITAMILLVGGAIHWQQRGRLESEMKSQRHVMSILEEHGFATGMDGKTKRFRLRHSEEEQKLRNELMRQLTLDLTDLQSRNGSHKHQLTAAERKKMTELYAQVMDLDFEEQLVVMQTIMDNAGVENRGWSLLCDIAPSMARKNPERFLDFMIQESASLHDINTGIFHHLWVPALVTIAQTDVDKAIRYFRDYNAEGRGLKLSQQDWGNIIVDLAAVDPVASFQMATELEAKDYIGFVLASGLRGKPEEIRAEALELMRSQGDEMLHRQFMQKTGEYLTDKSFEETLLWLKNAGLTKDELAMMVEGMEPAASTYKDTGEWLEWSMNQAPEVAITKVSGTMESWTKSDYKAAGGWLIGLPDGPFKRAAVVGYAGAAAPYDPEGASAWVATLPVGPERNQLARRVLENWKGESGARSAFARRERIGQ